MSRLYLADGGGRTIRIHDGAHLKETSRHVVPESIKMFTVSGNGLLLAVADQNKNIRILRTADMKELRVVGLQGPVEFVRLSEETTFLGVVITDTGKRKLLVFKRQL